MNTDLSTWEKEILDILSRTTIICSRHLALISHLIKIKKLVMAQAESEALWSKPIDRKEFIQEAFLKQSLRHLHAVIEGDIIDVDRLIKEFYDT